MDNLLERVEEIIKQDNEKNKERIKRQIKIHSERAKEKVFTIFEINQTKIGTNGLGYAFAGTIIHDIKMTNLDQKKWFVTELENEMKEWDKQGIRFLNRVLKGNVMEKKDRIRLITEHGNVSGYIFMDESEKEKIISSLCEIALIHLKKELSIPYEKYEVDYFKQVLYLYDSPFVKEFNISYMLPEGDLAVLTKKPIEALDDLKELLKNWFREKELKTLGEDYETWNVEGIKVFRYIMSDEQKNQVKEMIYDKLKKWTDLMEKRVKEYHSSQFDQLEKLKKQIEEFQTF